MELVPVDVMPPVYDWQGLSRLLVVEPHDTDWTVFVYGNEVVRVGSQDQIADVIWRALARTGSRRGYVVVGLHDKHSESVMRCGMLLYDWHAFINDQHNHSDH